MSGRLVRLAELGDGVFSEGLVGPGVAIDPESGQVCAPVDGDVTTVHPAGHAYVITSHDGIEVLVHVGLDSVRVGRSAFEPLVREGARVRAGDVLARVQLQALKAGAGVRAVSPVVVLNPAHAQVLEIREEGEVRAGRDPVMWARGCLPRPKGDA